MQIQVLEKSGILMKTSPCIGMNTHSLIPETGKVKYILHAPVTDGKPDRRAKECYIADVLTLSGCIVTKL